MKPLHTPRPPSAAPRASAGESYLPALDGLRAIAVLVVMVSHIVTAKIPGGFGVTLFFFVSGFIITRNCLEHGFAAADVVPFYVKRFFRLAPAVFAYILIAAVVVELLGSHLPRDDMLATVFYYANYHHFSNDVGHFRVAPLEMTWSLAVEEHFYIAFPLVLLWARKPLRLAAFLTGVIVVTCLWRQWLESQGAPFWSLYAHTDTRIDSIAYGCLLSAIAAAATTHQCAAAWLASLTHRATVSVALLCLVVSLWTEATVSHAYEQLHLVQGIALMPIFAHLFLAPCSSTSLSQRWLGSPLLVWIGRLSYSLYLFHVIANYATKELEFHTFGRVGLAFGFAFLGAFLSFRYVETPGRRWGRRLANRLRSLRLPAPEESPARTPRASSRRRH